MPECNLPECVQSKPPGEMTRVEDEIDGQRLVAHTCSPEHGRQLLLLWATGDRYSEPDPMWSTVGNGLVAA
jgi:hypothetical protein